MGEGWRAVTHSILNYSMTDDFFQTEGNSAKGNVQAPSIIGRNFIFRRGGGRILLMQKAKVIAKQSPMPPADEAAAGSSIGFGRRGDGGESHAVQGAGQRDSE